MRYSAEVGDSFRIFVHLPKSYGDSVNRNYPLVYLLDANLYFDIIATTLDKYADVGLAPDVILVGVGYKDFQRMDSLRNRDDTYPQAIAEYQMPVSGGAQRFLQFLDNNLYPSLVKDYRVDTAKTTVMGHSLGGYFTCFALEKYLEGQLTHIRNFVAASPSLHFNRYYLLDQFHRLPARPGTSAKAYLSFGSLETDQTDSTQRKPERVIQDMEAVLKGRVSFRGLMYSNFDHMDTQLPTFLLGLRFVLE